MAEGRLRFGLWGCGMIARFHADALLRIENAVLVGVADVSASFAADFADQYGIVAYADYEAMLADPNIDAVCICTPSGLHKENALQALRAGKHVVLEKPMAFTAAEAAELEKAAEESGCVLTVVSQLRFSKDICRVKALMEENAFGTPVLCDLYMKYWRDPAYYAGSTWKGTRRFDGGGALMNQGIHGVDILLYLAGNAKVLYAKNRTHFHNIEVEDVSVAMLEFENGATGVIEASTCANPGFERRLEIIGTEGSVILVENRIEKLILGGETVISGSSEPIPCTASDPAAMGCELHVMQLRNFVSAVQNGSRLAVTAADGRRAVALIEEIYSFSGE